MVRAIVKKILSYLNYILFVSLISVISFPTYFPSVVNSNPLFGSFLYCYHKLPHVGICNIQHFVAMLLISQATVFLGVVLHNIRMDKLGGL